MQVKRSFFEHNFERRRERHPVECSFDKPCFLTFVRSRRFCLLRVSWSWSQHELRHLRVHLRQLKTAAVYLHTLVNYMKNRRHKLDEVFWNTVFIWISMVARIIRNNPIPLHSCNFDTSNLQTPRNRKLSQRWFRSSLGFRRKQRMLRIQGLPSLHRWVTEQWGKNKQITLRGIGIYDTFSIIPACNYSYYSRCNNTTE